MDNNVLAEEIFGTGGKNSIKDDRDYLYKDIATAPQPYDWSQDFDIENVVGKMPVKNQGQTSSCGGFAWASLSYILDPTNREEKSEKFIYAHTHVGNGGSAGRDNCDFCVKKGDCSKTLCPLPNPLLEAEITRIDDITAEAYADALSNKEKSYVSVSCDIESVAQAIRDNGGVVLGIRGQNNGTWLTAFPRPTVNPTYENTWRHWMFAGKIKTIEGKKYIGALNSWGNIGQEGWQWFGEDYFKNDIWEVWTMIYNADVKYIFTKFLQRGSRGFEVKMLQTKLGIKADGIFGRQTRDAVIRFQTLNQLVPDGKVGKLTNSVLNK